MFNKSNVFLITILALFAIILIVGCGGDDNPASPDDDNPVGPETGEVTDIDGHVYKTIKIGDQWWMAENLRVLHYRNGEVIPKETEGDLWLMRANGAYCEYDNDPMIALTYGRIYNWYAVNDSRSIAPEGWHVPTDNEWNQLEMYLGMSQESADSTGYRGSDEGGKLKESDTTHWKSPNTGATNESGFSALPGGYRNYQIFDVSDYYYSLKLDATFWTSTDSSDYKAAARGLGHGTSKVSRGHGNKTAGYSVRCVKD